MERVEIFETEFFGPTNTLGSRIRVIRVADGSRAFFRVNHAHAMFTNHLEAVKSFVEIKKLSVREPSKYMSRKNGWVFVCGT